MCDDDSWFAETIGPKVRYHHYEGPKVRHHHYEVSLEALHGQLLRDHLKIKKIKQLRRPLSWTIQNCLWTIFAIIRFFTYNAWREGLGAVKMFYALCLA
jgi:hypothetical protein